MRPLHNEEFFKRARKNLFEDRSVLDVHEDLRKTSDNANFEKYLYAMVSYREIFKNVYNTNVGFMVN